MAVSREQDFPLSFAQQRLWFLDQLEPGSTAYNVPMSAEFKGLFELATFETSLGQVIARHEGLRTTFQQHEGHPYQLIHPASPPSFPLIDLQALPPQTREREVKRLSEQEASLPFDLRRGPLLRCWVARLEGQVHRVQLSLHHIISDGWSMGILVQEVTQFYQAARLGVAASLPALPIQYADYAFWQRQWLQGEVLKEQIRYWTQRLSEARAVELPSDHARGTILSPRGARQSFRIDAEVTQGLRALSREEGVTMFMTLLCGFQVLLWRLSGQQDIVVGTDSANRTRLETEGLIGFFVNVLVLRTQVRGQVPFRQLLREVREMVLGAYLHQELPFEMVVEHLHLAREGNRTPLINVLFVMQNTPLVQAELPDLVVRPIANNTASAKFELALFINEDSQGLYGSVNYNTDLFKSETIATLMQRYEALLHSIMLRPTARVMSLELATENEKVQKSREQVGLRQHLKMNQGERLQISKADRNRPE